MGLLIRFVGFLLVVALGVGAYGYVRMQHLDEPLGHGDKTIAVTIPKGVGFKRVVVILTEAGVLKDPLAFTLYGEWVKADRGIKAGDYVIDLGWTPKKLLVALREGTLPAQTKVTIPEGFNRWQIADLLSKRGLVDRVAFLRRVEREQLEGRLFPETYLFRSDTNTDVVIKRLTGQFHTVLQDLLKGKPVVDVDQAENQVEFPSQRVENGRACHRITPAGTGHDDPTPPGQ